MKVSTTTLWLPKKGNTDEEYEDAACPDEHVERECDEFRCAIADGATETSFSRSWAKLLVDGFVEGIDREQLRARWSAGVDHKELPWYAEQKAESGAYAALVGLVIKQTDGPGGTWEAEAIGDSCLIQLRGAEILSKFPLTKAAEFNSTPALLSSNRDDGKDHHEKLVTTGGDWLPGDIFYLLTDAIARWTYLRQEEYGDAAFYLQAMRRQKDLVEFAEVQRALTDAENRPLMRNDDVTLIRIILE